MVEAVIHCKITEKIARGTIDELISIAKGKHDFNKPPINIIVEIFDSNDNSKYTKINGRTMPAIYLTNTTPGNEALIYRDHTISEKDPHLQREKAGQHYTLARFLHNDPDDIPADLISINKMCFYPDRKGPAWLEKK